MQGRTLGFLVAALLMLPMMPQIGGSRQANESGPKPKVFTRPETPVKLQPSEFRPDPVAPSDSDASPTLPQLLKQLKECREQREQAIRQEKKMATAIRKLIAEQREVLDAAEK